MLSLLEIAECLSGAEIHSSESSDQSLLLTLVAKAGSHGSRILAIMFGSRDVRNAMLSGLRCAHALFIFSPSKQFIHRFFCLVFSHSTLTADATLVPSAKAPLNESPAGKQQRSTRRLSMREVVLEEKMSFGSPMASPPPKSKAEEEVRHCV